MKSEISVLITVFQPLGEFYMFKVNSGGEYYVIIP